MKAKTYEGQIIHFIGGQHEYIGKYYQKPHPHGENWHRILNPCLLLHVANPQNNTYGVRVEDMGGTNKVYKKFVDIYCPPDSIIEVRVLQTGGKLHESYKKEMERTAPTRIEVVSRGVTIPGRQ